MKTVFVPYDKFMTLVKTEELYKTSDTKFATVTGVTYNDHAALFFDNEAVGYIFDGAGKLITIYKRDKELRRIQRRVRKNYKNYGNFVFIDNINSFISRLSNINPYLYPQCDRKQVIQFATNEYLPRGVDICGEIYYLGDTPIGIKLDELYIMYNIMSAYLIMAYNGYDIPYNIRRSDDIPESVARLSDFQYIEKTLSEHIYDTVVSLSSVRVMKSNLTNNTAIVLK